MESSCHISTFKYFESEYVANSLFLEIREFYENQKNDNNENKGFLCTCVRNFCTFLSRPLQKINVMTILLFLEELNYDGDLSIFQFGIEGYLHTELRIVNVLAVEYE